MGDRVDASALVVDHDDEVQRRLQRCVAALQRMVDGGWFVGHEDTIGMRSSSISWTRWAGRG